MTTTTRRQDRPVIWGTGFRLHDRVHYIGRVRDLGTVRGGRGGMVTVIWDHPGNGVPVDSYDPDVLTLLSR